MTDVKPAKVFQKKPRKKKTSENYIDNELLYKQLCEYHEKAQAAKAAGLPAPVASNAIGKAILDVCENLTNAPCFIRYTFKDQMIGDAIEKCVAGLHTFNPYAETRSGKPNAFSWLTQIAFYAFIARIEKEKAYFALKHKNRMHMLLDNLMTGRIDEVSDETSVKLEASTKVIEDYENAQAAKKERLKKKIESKEIGNEPK